MCLAKRVAVEIIVKCDEQGIDLDYFKLQRLLYIAQCVHYKVYGVNLFPEKIWRWDNGGGIKEIYSFVTNELYSYTSFPIIKIKKMRDVMDDLLYFEETTINFVISNYGSKSLKELIDLTLQDPYYNVLEMGDRVRLENLHHHFITNEQAKKIHF